MSLEPMRAALGRWGDPIYGLALVMTGRAPSAEHLTVAAFRHAITGSPAEWELAQYTALAHAPKQRRLRLPGRSLLDRSLAPFRPRDRLLLALWLVAGQNGERLGMVFGVAPEKLVARLDHLLGPDDTAPEPAPHLMRGDWLRRSLFGDDAASAHLRLCTTCRTRVADWQAGADALQKQLRAITGNARLPRTAVEALVAEPSVPDGTRRRWVPGLLLVAIVLLLVAIVVPWPRQQARETVASLTPPALVEAALARWATAPAVGAMHRQVRAAPLWNEGEPFMLDVWQAANGRHRWEAHRGKVLVEWQLADGRDTLRYGSEPEHASCRWKAGELPRTMHLREGGLTFAASPAQQHEALAGRLQEGAYGTGYALLQRALAAPDLRSLGRRQTAGGRFTVLHFSDTIADPAREVVLEIDAAGELHAAQALAEDGQAAHDLWRVLVDDSMNEVSLALPGGMSGTREQLVDPACPALDFAFVLSPRELAFLPFAPDVPAAIPEQATAAWFADSGRDSATLSQESTNMTLLVTRPAGRLALEISGMNQAAPLPVRPPDADVIERGRWRLVLRRNTKGALTGWIEAREATQLWQPWYNLRSTGWSRDELAAFAGSLAPLEVFDVATYEARFWDPNPLPEAVREALYRALAAERPAPGTTERSDAQIEIRTGGDQVNVNAPADPYSAAIVESPPQMLLRRILRTDQDGAVHGRLETRLPDETLLRVFATDGARMAWYDAQYRLVNRGPASPNSEPRITRATQLDLLIPLLGTGEHTVTRAGEDLVVERRWPFDATSMPLPQSWTLPSPSTVGLRAGEFVARLTLRGGDGRVSGLEVVHRAEAGEETLLQRVAVTVAPAPATSDLLALPPLSADMLVVESRLDRPAEVVVADPDWVARTFEWPATAAEMVSDVTPEGGTNTADFEQLRSATWRRLGPSKLWRVSEYRLQPGGQPVTLTQGPAGILGYVLRSWFSEERWARSEALAVTIDGREHEAWLLGSINETVLVVEVDSLLLHLAVPASGGSAQTAGQQAEDLLRGPVREALALLGRSDG